jgi:hypothetical protein
MTRPNSNPSGRRGARYSRVAASGNVDRRVRDLLPQLRLPVLIMRLWAEPTQRCWRSLRTRRARDGSPSTCLRRHRGRRARHPGPGGWSGADRWEIRRGWKVLASAGAGRGLYRHAERGRQRGRLRSRHRLEPSSPAVIRATCPLFYSAVAWPSAVRKEPSPRSSSKHDEAVIGRRGVDHESSGVSRASAGQRR